MNRTILPAAVPLCRNCGRQHRRWHTLAECLYPEAAWVNGRGPWASIANCPRGMTIQLYETQVEADHAKTQIDHTGCGGSCWGSPWHKIAYLGDGHRGPRTRLETIPEAVALHRAAGRTRR